MNQFSPPHPGEILKEEIMTPLGLEARDVADRAGIPEETVNYIIEGRGSITLEIAEKLSKIFSTTVQFWLNLQSSHDKWMNKNKTKS